MGPELLSPSEEETQREVPPQAPEGAVTQSFTDQSTTTENFETSPEEATRLQEIEDRLDELNHLRGYIQFGLPHDDIGGYSQTSLPRRDGEREAKPKIEVGGELQELKVGDMRQLEAIREKMAELRAEGDKIRGPGGEGGENRPPVDSQP